MKKLWNILLTLLSLVALTYTRKVRKSKRGYMVRENIIFVMADDLDVYLNSTSVMKKTERLLKDQGVTFTNAFTTSPLCCPSRSSILTGRYAHNHHVNSNNKNCSGPEWIAGPEKQSIGKLMQEAGYRTAYFGKYLNNYDGSRVPPGWDHWSGLLRNSRFYNYTLNINGRFERHGSNYEKDYFTNVIADQSIKYFTKQKQANITDPLFMVVSMAAPHGPEDAAPEHQKMFPDVKAPRYPNYNYSSLDKHWIIRKTPPMTKAKEHFTDVLHRKRLQTLLSLDDAIEKLYIMLLKTNQLKNTYFVFSSDHGYHLGQFNQVKGKAQPYEADIRIPLYIRGPKIPSGVKVDDIALNIDLTPTFLDIANRKPPKFIDGTSLMDVAVGSVINRIKRKVLKPIWKDTFLVERGKLQQPVPATNDVGRYVFPTARKVRKACYRRYPRPPCTAQKKFVCYTKNNSWFLERCPKENQDAAPTCACSETSSAHGMTSSLNTSNRQVDSLLFQLEKHFERLKRRIKRHGMEYLNKITDGNTGRYIVVANKETLSSNMTSNTNTEVFQGKPNNNNQRKQKDQQRKQKDQQRKLKDQQRKLKDQQRKLKDQQRKIKDSQRKQKDSQRKQKEQLRKTKDLQQKPSYAKSKSKSDIESLVDRKIKRSEQKLNYWMNERKKISKNRVLKATLTRKLTDTIKKTRKPLSMTPRKPKVINNTSSSGELCSCVSSGKRRVKKVKRKKSGPRGRDMNCFQMTQSHWKTPPFWDGPAFTACTNSPNSTYWCLRTVNKTHNFLYCEFITGFKEYFDVNKDPYQLDNIVDTIAGPILLDLHKLLVTLKDCRGALDCFVRRGQTFYDRRDILRKWRRFERKKRHGIYIRAISRS